jgi:hypothetical protein
MRMTSSLTAVCAVFMMAGCNYQAETKIGTSSKSAPVPVPPNAQDTAKKSELAVKNTTSKETSLEDGTFFIVEPTQSDYNALQRAVYTVLNCPIPTGKQPFLATINVAKFTNDDGTNRHSVSLTCGPDQQSLQIPITLQDFSKSQQTVRMGGLNCFNGQVSIMQRWPNVQFPSAPATPAALAARKQLCAIKATL